MTTKEILQESQKAKLFLALTDTEVKNNALQSMAQSLVENTASILEANTKDTEVARQHISEVMLDRLMVNEERLQSMARGILDVVKLDDPVGKVLKTIERPNGLKIDKVSVPMGVIAIIYESRPNVTSDAAALALK
ncbi:MAG: gamma-glutamyl-phosphate reductase, partial [Bulleidia sp.]|nr:gamma-glutamyl-phosphate reductase [Bulleidia sp.]